MSRFLKNSGHLEEEPHIEGIDFEDAFRLPDGGSTCDIYRTRWHRRDVFVKRLKEEHRTNPLYLDALDKEYEIGVSLKHPSLPDYREFFGDYIVMDYIDGTTLANLIKNNDSWLKNERNILRLLKELVEVTAYLHQHNVTHCDIKPDNIMIRANNHNVVLIDLDKCYTDSLNDTSGDPSKYGLSRKETGSITIDFHGIGRVVEKLKEGFSDFKFRRYRKFINACQDNECSSDKLLEILNYTPASFSIRYKLLMTGIALTSIIIFLWFWFTSDNKQDSVINTTNEKPYIISKDSTFISGYGMENQKVAKETETPTLKEKPSEPQREDASTVPAKTTPQSDYQQIATKLDLKIQPYFDELNSNLDNLVTYSNNSEVTGSQLLEKIRQYADKEDEYCEEMFMILNNNFPGLDDDEKWKVIARSKVYTGYKRRAEPIKRELGLKVKN